MATPTCWGSTVSDGDLVNGEPPEFATGPFQLNTGCAYKSHQGYDRRPGFVKMLLFHKVGERPIYYSRLVLLCFEITVNLCLSMIESLQREVGVFCQ